MPQLKKSTSKKGALAMSLATASILTLGALGTALADTSNQTTGPASGERRGVFGSVTAKGATTFTLLGRGGETLVVTVNDQTKFRIPGDADPSFGDLATGQRVAALVRREAEGLVALQVMPVPGQPQREHRVLTVVDVAGKTITAQDAQGNQITVELAQEISPELKGQVAIFIGEQSRQSNRFKANAEVKIERVVERLEAHASKLQEEAEGEDDAEAKTRKEFDATRLTQRLEANRQQHLDRLDRVIARAPEAAKGSLEQARARFEAQQADDRARFEAQQEQARARFKEQYEARLRAGENPRGTPQERPGVVRPRPDGVGANSRSRAVQGVVQVVDLSASRITILTLDGTVTTLDITEEARIRVGDRPVAIGDLAEGARVTVYYNPGRPPVDAPPVKDQARQVLTGTLMSVEPGSGTITVGTREGSVQTLRISSSAPPQVQAALKELTVLLPGTQVVIKYVSSGSEILEMAVGRADAGGPKPTPPVYQPANPQMDRGMEQKKLQQTEQESAARKRLEEQKAQEQARARFYEEQALAWRAFQDQQAQALKRFYTDQEPARVRFQEEQKLALARLQEQTKDERSLLQFQEEQKQALTRFHDEQAQALKQFQTDQAQARARFQEEQKQALARFQGQR